MHRLKCMLSLALSAVLGVSAQAQQGAPAPAWSVGGIEFSGLVDGYYSYNFNHPASRANQLRNFDLAGGQFDLSMAKLVMEHAPDPAGFRVDLGFGKAFDAIHGAEPGLSAFRNVQQAYISYKPKAGKGLQLDFGKHVTMAGAEVIETHSNWNYSRSLLFALAIPYYHMGLRASLPVGSNFTAGFHLVNGWNNVADNNSGKTVGVTGVLSAGPVTWSNNYYAGPEKPNSNKGWRHLYDTTLLLSHDKASTYFNFDYGAERNPAAPAAVWYGFAGAARFAVSQRVAVSPRLEWFNDRDGFATGVPQKLKEFTLTGEYKMAEGILSRVEFRRDWSDTRFFERGAGPGLHKSQNTVLVGFVAYFGPKR
ncbi:MAG: porin [Bryobacteraceae bacterium]|nr:porin [Bryobacteraceae bacterium]